MLFKNFLFNIIIIILFVMITGKLTIIFFLSILLIQNVQGAACESCENCQIINVKKQCLKCLPGYRLSSIRGHCVPKQGSTYQFTRVVSITFNDQPSNEKVTESSDSVSASAAQKISRETSKSLRNQNQLNIRYSQNKNSLSNIIISRFYDVPQKKLEKASYISNPFTVDLHCQRYQGRICRKCQFRYFMQSGICKKIGSGCQSWSEEGQCLTCYLGFALNEKGQCIFDVDLYYPSVTKSQKDVNSTLSNSSSVSTLSEVQSLPNCLQNDKIGNCLKCAFRFYLMNGICYRVSDLCKDWSLDTGSCISCYQNYILSGNSCVLSVKVQSIQSIQVKTANESAFKTITNPIPNCSEFDADGSCTKCAYRHYKKNNVCQPIHGDCKSWSIQNGGCTQCYKEFQLKESRCIKIQEPEFNKIIFAPPPVKGCAELSKDGVCQKCALRFVLMNGFCKNVIDQCKTWQLTNGDCKQCYEGYNLSGVGCQKSAEKSYKKQIPIDSKTAATVQQALTIDDIIVPNKSKNQSQNGTQKIAEKGLDIGQIIFQKKISQTLK